MAIDRETWQLVREELRSLWKVRNPKGALVQAFNPYDEPFKDGNLNESTLRKYQQMVRRGMDELGAFGLEATRAKMMGANAAADVKSFYYWTEAPFNVTHMMDDRPDHEQTLLGLNHINFALDKKRLVADDIECSVFMNEHALARMIERGCVGDRPLAFVNQEVHNWFPLMATLLVLEHQRDDRPLGVLIPCGPGAFLARFSFKHTEYSDKPSGHPSRQAWPSHLTRLVDGAKTRSLGDVPGPDFLQTQYEGQDGRGSLHIATWIHKVQFSSEQWWSFLQINELMQEYPDLMKLHTFLIHSFHQETISLKRADEFVNKLVSIMSHRKWIAACTI